MSDKALIVNSPSLLTLKEVACLLQVSPKTVYYWVNRSEIPYVKVGRHLRFNYQGVLDFFAEQTRATKMENRRSVTGCVDSRSLKFRTIRNRNFTPTKE
jgi:excisionase family DNA binding protein